MVSVIGAGAWGSAIYHAIKQKTKACITSRRKRDIEGFVSIDEALKNEYIIVVIAAQAIREFLKTYGEKLKNKKCKIKKLPSSEYQVPSWEINCEEKKIVIIEDTAENFKINKKVDLITAFMAIRNFDDIKKGIKNLDEHLNDGGYFAIVEMVKNDSLLAKLILWYMNNVVPLIAGLLVGMKEEYKLLGKSINSLTEEDILKHFDNYTIVKKKKLIFPIATMIIMRKNERKNT